jgi:ribbon-helix-helix protein
MKRTTVFLEEQAEQELRILAERDSVPAASLLREAVDQYLVARRRKAKTSLGFLAAGRSGSRTTAENHEELLFQDLRANGPSAKKLRKAARKS